MLSHDNLAWTAFSCGSAQKVGINREMFVSYLPLNHIAAQIVDIWVPIACQVRFGLISYA